MTLTHYVILVTFALWIWFTSVSRQMFGAPTISMTLRNMAWTFSSFAFVWGMLIAHWFAPRQSLPTSLWGWSIGLPMILALLGWDIYWLVTDRPRAWYRWPMFYFVAGLPIGFFFWPQVSAHAPF